MPRISVVIPVYNGEKDLENMLDSLLQQTFHDYEVLVINDGSTDGTQEIAEEFSRNDSRFHVILQDNQGVSAARNHGMDVACGEYIVFFDGDDWVPPDALESMHRALQVNQADMTVGILETASDGKCEPNHASEILALQKEIDPSDAAFIKTWSQCNKMYRREFLVKNEIRFLPVKVAEDGHFLYQALMKFPRICGCNTIVYQYRRRPFWEGLHTASKSVDSMYLTDRLQVYEDMLQMIRVLLKGKSQEEFTEYQDILVSRFLKGGITQAFYRRIWRCDETLETTLAQAVQHFRRLLTDERWKKLCEEEWDIPLEKIAYGRVTEIRDYFCLVPEITLILTGLDAVTASIVIESLVNQEFPSFEVFLDKYVLGSIKDQWKYLSNLHALPEDADVKGSVEQYAKGRFVGWIDEPVIFPIHALKRMVNTLKQNESISFISAYVQPIRIDGGNVEKADNVSLRSIEAVFGPFQRDKRVFQRIDWTDNLTINKLFRKTAVGKAAIGMMPVMELMELYQTCQFRKIRNAWILTDITDRDLQERAEGKVGSWLVSAYALRNRFVRWAGHIVRNIMKR